MVAEGFDTLTKINEAYVDDNGRPFKDIRWSFEFFINVLVTPLNECLGVVMGSKFLHYKI
jgi:hypothetical protein